MALFEFGAAAITRLTKANFSGLGLLERGDLQRLLRDHVDVIAPETLVISEEFSSWDRSDRRIDLLAIDRQARLVVIELKRTADDSFADLQALRYAAMVSKMTFEEAVESYRNYLEQREAEGDARTRLLEFLGWEDSPDVHLGEDVRIVLAAADFSAEVTSTVLWLNERDLDITCVRLQPYKLGTTVLLDVQQIIPLPEASEYQIQIRQKRRETRAAVEQTYDLTKYDVTTGSTLHKALNKRDAVLMSTQFLITSGVSPAQIEEAVGRKMFESMDGQVDCEAFLEELARRRPNDRYSARRYFTRDDQLFFHAGKTYALSTQWSKTTMESAMARLVAEFGSKGLSFRVSGEGTQSPVA